MVTKAEPNCDNWVDIIQQHIDESIGQQKSAPGTDKFWKQDQISERQFIEKADTFDILLFKTDNVSGAGIRTFTNCEFDHVAMVLKYEVEPDEVFFLEANGAGVMLKRWSGMRDMVGVGCFFSKVAIRHLEWERPDDVGELMDKFYEEVEGAEYKNPVPYALLDRQTSAMITKEKSNSLIPANKTMTKS